MKIRKLFARCEPGIYQERGSRMTKSVTEVDKYVGERIKECRLALEMTQEKLGKTVGCKFQQIQKYEAGTNRVSASRLFAIAKALNVDVEYFFPYSGPSRYLPSSAPTIDRQCVTFAKVYTCLQNQKHREVVKGFVYGLSTTCERRGR